MQTKESLTPNELNPKTVAYDAQSKERPYKYTNRHMHIHLCMKTQLFLKKDRHPNVNGGHTWMVSSVWHFFSFFMLVFTV